MNVEIFKIHVKQNNQIEKTHYKINLTNKQMFLLKNMKK